MTSTSIICGVFHRFCFSLLQHTLFHTVTRVERNLSHSNIPTFPFLTHSGGKSSPGHHSQSLEGAAKLAVDDFAQGSFCHIPTEASSPQLCPSCIAALPQSYLNRQEFSSSQQKKEACWVSTPTGPRRQTEILHAHPWNHASCSAT